MVSFNVIAFVILEIWHNFVSIQKSFFSNKLLTKEKLRKTSNVILALYSQGFQKIITGLCKCIYWSK